MNKEDLILLNLIKQSQFGQSEAISFDGVDMDTLYKEALQQSVLGLIAAEIPALYSNNKWYEAQYRSKASYILYCNAQDKLKDILDRAHIPFVILKGNASAFSYRVPSLRAMGDIDFLVPAECFEKAQDVLKDSGYIWDHVTDRHVSFKRDKMTFELHKRFSHDIDLEDYIAHGLDLHDNVSIDGHYFPMLPKLANGLVLLDHLRAHLKSAVGLRHVIDWMMYVYRNLDDDFWCNKFKTVADEKKMTTLALTVTRMCQIYLGLPETITWCRGADDVLCNQLMDLILKSGNFGRKNGQGSSIEKVSTHFKRDGFFVWLQRRGEINWESYQKHHWLKPFCWFYQLCRYSKQGFKSGRNRNQLKEDFERSNERYGLLKKLRIE